MNPTQPTPGATAEACALRKDLLDISTQETSLETIDRHFAPLLARVAELEQFKDANFRQANKINEITSQRAKFARELSELLGLKVMDEEGPSMLVVLRDKLKQLAAAKGAVRALEEIKECAAAIRRNIDDDQWSEKQDPLWVPTIHAHAHVIEQDAHHCLAACAAAGLDGKEEGK